MLSGFELYALTDLFYKLTPRLLFYKISSFSEFDIARYSWNSTGLYPMQLAVLGRISPR